MLLVFPVWSISHPGTLGALLGDRKTPQQYRTPGKIS
jgi:hypothetical protein